MTTAAQQTTRHTMMMLYLQQNAKKGNAISMTSAGQ